jgi:hypothetical protein
MVIINNETAACLPFEISLSPKQNEKKKNSPNSIIFMSGLFNYLIN